ncbi:hypothetical protein UPYG_G00043400 [Umbra pygmaea]|uniref:Uncharacterized protein n=1 Tax=Umbra pygmaea TaxID=75934 RepID=A0ABD0XQH8_UMBPY
MIHFSLPKRSASRQATRSLSLAVSSDLPDSEGYGSNLGTVKGARAPYSTPPPGRADERPVSTTSPSPSPLNYSHLLL